MRHPPLAYHAEGARLRADRRHHRRADNFAARAARRHAQLGLPLLLVARRDHHPARDDARRGGYYDEARAWRAWLGRVMAGSPSQIQIMYGIAGERRLPEYEIPWLPGYKGAAPVRIGNSAIEQLQLDVYGEVMNAVRVCGLQSDETAWSIQCAMLNHLDTIWHLPDEGIWEVRGGRQHFTFSKVIAWIAYDRAINSAEKFELPGPIDHWRDMRAHPL